jgi:hypothetical protein
MGEFDFDRVVGDAAPLAELAVREPDRACQPNIRFGSRATATRAAHKPFAEDVDKAAIPGACAQKVSMSTIG